MTDTHSFRYIVSQTHAHTYKLTKKSGATGGGDACIADKLKKNKRKNVPRIEKFFLHM